MLDSQAAGSLTLTNLVTPVGAAANTAAATSAWTQVTGYEGYLVFHQHVGTISTGTLIGTIQSATDGSGTGSATVGTFVTVTTATDAPNIQSVVLPATIGNYVRYVGTLSAGTADIAVSMIGSKQSN